MTTARPARRAAIARRSPARRARSLVVTGGHLSSDFHRFADAALGKGGGPYARVAQALEYAHVGTVPESNGPAVTSICGVYPDR